MKYLKSYLLLLIIFTCSFSIDIHAYQTKSSQDNITFSNITPITNKKSVNKKTPANNKSNTKNINKKNTTSKKTPTNKKNPAQKKSAAPKKTSPQKMAAPKRSPTSNKTQNPPQKNQYPKNPSKINVNSKNYESFWNKGTFPTKAGSVEYHTKKHADGRNSLQYTNDAVNFYENNKNLRRPTKLQDGSQGYRITNGKEGGIWDQEGKIITFWKNP